MGKRYCLVQKLLCLFDHVVLAVTRFTRLNVMTANEGVLKKVVEVSEQLAPRLRDIRTRIHQNPELGLTLPATQKTVLDALHGLDLEVTTGTNLDSVVAVLRGDKRGENPHAVLLRGDMDALPVTEATGFEFASTNGNMHACGHDLHVTGLIGAAHILHACKSELAGDVVFMFQPGEEGHDGAGKMVDEGVLEAAGVPVVAAFGVHVSADQPPGHVYSKPGSYMASANNLEITVRGRGGHAARPEAALDPVQVGASIVGQLQEFVSRHFFAWDPVVLTVGQFQAGTAPNVIPDSAYLAASVRTFSEETTSECERVLPALVEGIAHAHGLTAEVNMYRLLPATINNNDENALYLETAEALFGTERVHLMDHPRVGSEDFSRILDLVPGSYGHFGAAYGPEDTWEANHSPRARHTDTALGDQAAFLAALALNRLNKD